MKIALFFLAAGLLAAEIVPTPDGLPDARQWHLNRCDYQSNGVWYAAAPVVVEPTPQQFPTGIESASIGIAQTNGSVVGLAVTPSLDVIGYLDHASPRTGWEQRRDAAIASNQTRMAALRTLKTSTEYTTLTNRLAGLDADYSVLTNQLSTLDFSKPAWTNKLANILDRLAQCVDGNRDVSKKAVKLVKELAGNQ